MDQTKTKDEERAFDEGARARHAGKSIGDNPYDIQTEAETDLCVAWRDGWRQAGRAVKRPAKAKPAELTAAQIRVGVTYRGKRFMQGIGCNNDRTVIWISEDRKSLQYDSDTVKQGARYPRIDMSKFLRWVKCETPAEEGAK